MASFTTSPLEALLGATLSSKSGDVSTSSLASKSVVGLYFSAHWCGPCRGFTPELAKSYTKMVASGKPFEIVFVSSDRDEASFASYFGEMPWLALPFAARDVKATLSKKFKVQGIPTLVLLNGSTGEVITTDGREAIDADPEGADFPWTPKSIDELLGDSFVRPDGTVVTRASLAGKSLGLYFSAHWCPPCRGYTPKLAKMYSDMKAAGRDDFEFIFVSSDKDLGAFKEYHGEMPWLALPFDKRAEKEALSSRFGVGGIPTLVTLDAAGKVVNGNARGASMSDTAGFPWAPKPYAELSETADCNGSNINETTSLVLVLDGCTAAVQEASTAALQAAATTRAAADKAAGKGVSFLFYTATAEDGPVGQVKGLCKVTSTETPVAIILDIPDNGGYYSKELPEVTVESIGAFLADYEAKKLTRKQLGK